jgi:hypothetical protein
LHSTLIKNTGTEVSTSASNLHSLSLNSHLHPRPYSVKALYDYTAACDEELSFSAGDAIQVTNTEIGSLDWWEGTLNGRSGQFPIAYVELNETSSPLDEFGNKNGQLTSQKAKRVTEAKESGRMERGRMSLTKKVPYSAAVDAASPTHRLSSRQVRALYSYQPQSEAELRFTAGDVIQVIEEQIEGDDDHGWLKGKLGSHIGQVPRNYVQPI